MLTRRLVEAIKDKNHTETLKVIEEMTSILDDLPADLIFHEAEARLELGQLVGGKKALDRYLQKAGTASKFYDKALDHYIVLKKKIAQKILDVRAETNSRMAAKGANLMGAFEMFAPERLRQKQGEQILSVKHNRVGDLIRDKTGNACEVSIFDYVTIDVATRTYTQDGRPITRNRFKSFDWLNNNTVRLPEIRAIRQIDMLSSKSPANRNFLMVNLGPGRTFKIKFKMDNDRFIDSNPNQRVIDSKELAIALPSPGMGQYLTKQLLYLRDLCQITKE